MGLKEWWIRHGPGSPGKIAKTMAMVATIIRRAYPQISLKEVLLRTFRTRYSRDEISDRKARKMVGTPPNLEGLTIRVIRREYGIAGRTEMVNPDLYPVTLQIIRDVTRKYAPWAESATAELQKANELREDLTPLQGAGLQGEFVLGSATITKTIRISKIGRIAILLVTKGKIERSAKVRVVRGGVIIHEGKIQSMRRFNEDVNEVAQGLEGGVKIAGFNGVKEGDVIKAIRV